MEEFDREIMELVTSLGTFERYFEQGISRHRMDYDPDIIDIFREALKDVGRAKSSLLQAVDYLDDRY